MIKNVLAAAVVAATMPAVAQQTVNNEGTGQVLLFPYYNVQNGATTFLHLSNNAGDAKAVKIRFMEGIRSAVVLEFNAYLAPYDVMPLAVSATESGLAAVLTTDSSCTVPELGTPNGDYPGTQVPAGDLTLRTQPFVPYQYESDKTVVTDRGTLGHAEVIEMGVVDTSIDVSDCAAVSKLWTSGDWSTDPSTDVGAPSGGLSGNSYLVVPDLAYSMSFDVTAIDGWAKAGTNAGRGYHYGAGTLKPELSQGVSTATVFDGSDYVTLDYSKQDDGAVLATGSILATALLSNEVQVEDAIAAQTDWVVTFPTKKHSMAGGTASAPFTKAFDGTKEVNLACEAVNLVRRDRDSNSSTGTGTFVPDEQGVEGDLCGSVNVMSFNGKSALVSNDFIPVSFPYQNGAASVTMGQSLPADDNGVVVSGLPAIGFASTRIVNGDKSYGYSSAHKTLTVTSGG